MWSPAVIILFGLSDCSVKWFEFLEDISKFRVKSASIPIVIIGLTIASRSLKVRFLFSFPQLPEFF